MKKEIRIAYEPHPISVERKRELNAQGFKIIDARFKPSDDETPDNGNIAQETKAEKKAKAKAKREAKKLAAGDDSSQSSDDGDDSDVDQGAPDAPVGDEE